MKDADGFAGRYPPLPAGAILGDSSRELLHYIRCQSRMPDYDS